MADRRFTNEVLSTLDESLSTVSDPSQEVDRASQDTKETTYVNSNWATYNGFYRQYPEVKAAVDKLALWTVGKGYKSNKVTETKLAKIKGFGKDSFNSIMENMVKVKKINGDSFAEIIKDSRGRLINLKPLNPGVINIVANRQGILTGYEQLDIGKKTMINSFKPEEIFHLCNDREADEIHGVSIFEALNRNLKNVRQLDDDMGLVFHRYVQPLILFHLDTDDASEISKIKTDMDKAINTGQNLYIPKGAVVPEVMSINQFSRLDPLTWRQEWIQEGIKSTGVPELIMGRANDITEASSKIVYLAFQQTVEKEQRCCEEQLKLQLGIEIKYEFPARIEENLGEDEGKDSSINLGKRSEVKVTSEKIGEVKKVKKRVNNE